MRFSRFMRAARRTFFKTMAALLMLSLAAGCPGSDALQAGRFRLMPDTVAQPSAPARVLSITTARRGHYYGSHPAEDVYVTQTIKHTCTLVAATMMIRNYACQRGTRTGWAWASPWGLAPCVSRSRAVTTKSRLS